MSNRELEHLSEFETQTLVRLMENIHPSESLYYLTEGGVQSLLSRRSRIGFKATRTGGLREGHGRAPWWFEGRLRRL